MTPEESLTIAIQASAPLIAVVGTAVYPDFLRQERDLPGIAYLRQDTEYFPTIHDAGTATRTTFEVYVMARSRTDSVTIGDLFETAMRTAKHYYSNRRAEFDGENEIWSTVFTVSVFLS